MFVNESFVDSRLHQQETPIWSLGRRWSTEDRNNSKILRRPPEYLRNLETTTGHKHGYKDDLLCNLLSENKYSSKGFSDERHV